MRLNEIDIFYKLLAEIEKKFPKRPLGDLLKLKNKIPDQGVYFFFEKSETRENSNIERVVRVGTHAAQANSKATIKQRLGQHKGPEHFKGKHRSSVFRELIGYSLISAKEIDMEYWGDRDKKSDKRTLSTEENLEIEVSRYLRKMSYTILEVPGLASKDNDRAFIERNSIALLSNYQRPKIDPPSENWLGKLCGKNRIIQSGLWNSNFVEIESIDTNFFNKMEKYIEEMKKWC